MWLSLVLNAEIWYHESRAQRQALARLLRWPQGRMARRPRRGGRGGVWVQGAVSGRDRGGLSAPSNRCRPVRHSGRG